eukprot:CAMPEP_0172834834 /NCGR_PEP_ID=MMETSP1075-20121228/25322_1 /TAXON_ID=2916 /ORGANISM="Ceratium fusus, Strain PA161109" /LENGTH=191 /DNA_ID=CAMNT_0013677779 /DNA_START=52 /DNA_END=627 /DNA_ORIENTATION=-
MRALELLKGAQDKPVPPKSGISREPSPIPPERHPSERKEPEVPEVEELPEIDPDCVFVYYDRDGDGRLSKDEFLSALRALGACPNTADFEDVCQKLGSNLDHKALHEAWKKLFRQRPTSDKLIAQFRGLSQEGMIDKNVLRFLATNYGERLNEDEVNELLKLAKPDSDGQINVEHLANALMPALPQAHKHK